MTRTGTVEAVKSILKEITGFPTVELDMCLDDMYLDDIDMVQLLEDVKDETGVDVAEGDEQNWMTVNDIVDYISDRY